MNNNFHSSLRKFYNHPAGSMVIEVLLSLAMMAIIAVVIGNTLIAVHRLEGASDLRNRALTYTKQALEIITSLSANMINNPFVCSSSASFSSTPNSGTVISDQCQLNSDTTKKCRLPSPAYVSCWLDQPVGLSNNSDLHLQLISGNWKLVTIAPADEVPTPFNRTITIQNQNSPADSNIKTITATVTWTERGNTKQLQLSTILTAWKNL